MNMTAAYTHYIDDGQWTSIGAIFAAKGTKHVPFNGYYIGPERIAHRPGAKPAVNSTNPGRGGWHWLLQPVVHVAPDGRSAKMRTRLFHPGTGFNSGGSLEGGMYPNNQAVLEKGVWKLWTVTIDEPYFSSQFPHGWSRTAPPRASARGRRARPAGRACAAERQASSIRPDIPTRTCWASAWKASSAAPASRAAGLGILTMWFHYKNLGERPRAGVLLAQLRHLRIRAGDQHGQARLHAAAVIEHARNGWGCGRGPQPLPATRALDISVRETPSHYKASSTLPVARDISAFLHLPSTFHTARGRACHAIHSKLLAGYNCVSMDLAEEDLLNSNFLAYSPLLEVRKSRRASIVRCAPRCWRRRWRCGLLYRRKFREWNWEQLGESRSRPGGKPT